MPQETDTPALVSVLFVVWLGWIVASWVEYLKQLGQSVDARRRDARQDDVMAAIARASTTPAVADLLDSEILEDFLPKALTAYESIVAAFDAGDRETLRKLVSPDVYEAFSDAIARREAQGIRTETVFSRIEPPQIVDRLADATHVEVSVRFVGESFRLSRDKAGRLTQNAPVAFRSVDTWTFARTRSASDSDWRLVVTGP